MRLSVRVRDSSHGVHVNLRVPVRVSVRPRGRRSDRVRVRVRVRVRADQYPDMMVRVTDRDRDSTTLLQGSDIGTACKATC